MRVQFYTQSFTRAAGSGSQSFNLIKIPQSAKSFSIRVFVDAVPVLNAGYLIIPSSTVIAPISSLWGTSGTGYGISNDLTSKPGAYVRVQQQANAGADTTFTYHIAILF